MGSDIKDTATRYVKHAAATVVFVALAAVTMVTGAVAGTVYSGVQLAKAGKKTIDRIRGIEPPPPPEPRVPQHPRQRRTLAIDRPTSQPTGPVKFGYPPQEPPEWAKDLAKERKERGNTSLSQ